jgi:hypothetical protein
MPFDLRGRCEAQPFAHSRLLWGFGAFLALMTESSRDRAPNLSSGRESRWLPFKFTAALRRDPAPPSSLIPMQECSWALSARRMATAVVNRVV